MSKDLNNRLSRVQGQIEAIKKGLDLGSDKPEDCLKQLQLLKASINGLKKFGAAYLAEKVEECTAQKKDQAELNALLKIAIETGFNL